MLVKLTPWEDFTYVLPAAFTRADPKSAKDTDDFSVFLSFWIFVHKRLFIKMLVKLTPRRMVKTDVLQYERKQKY